MSDASSNAMKVLVVDVGGTHVKFASTDHTDVCEFPSGPELTPAEMIDGLRKLTRKWRYDAVSIGYPSVVRNGRPAREPFNLGPGWVDFAFEKAFDRPVRILNDAAMQALGNYQHGKMLFLGLGTGLGTTLVVDGLVVPMELAHLPRCKNHDYEHYVGNHARKRLGDKKWRAEVRHVVRDFRNALLPDDIVLGGGNARRLKKLPPHTRLGDTLAAFRGGFRLWETPNRKSENVVSAPVLSSAPRRKRKRAQERPTD